MAFVIFKMCNATTIICFNFNINYRFQAYITSAQSIFLGGNRENPY